ncbi:MAG: recombinase family protein [Subdoligranulum sp.]|nr:recombinase family protein [Subdoligranulum sp.]
MMRDAKDQKMDLIICASISRFARNFSDCMTQIAALKTMHPAHPIGVYFETENIYTLNPSSQYSLDIQALLADWESGNKSRRMILSYDQRIMTGQYPVADLMGYRHTKDGQLVIEPEEAKTVRFIFLAFIQGYNYDQIAMILTQKKRSTLRGKQEWNGMMVANIMKNERRWGDLEARKSIVVDYKLGKVTKNNGNRCSAYVPEHHEAIVSPEIARAAHLVASSRKKCGVQDIVVIQQGTLKGFVGIHPNWSGISVESIRSLCLSTYLPEEVMQLNDIAEMRAGATLGKALQSEYMTVSGACFINQSSPVMTISKNGIRFSKACHSRLDDCEYVELLYHPILQVVILRKSNHGFSTTMRWRDDNDVHSAFSARAFSGLVFQTLNWRRNCRYQCRGICRGQGNAKFLIFELDESRILTGKNQYEQENCSMNLKCRLYRSKWVQSITVSDVMESGQVVENPMIGAIPSRNEVQRELDDLLMSM